MTDANSATELVPRTEAVTFEILGRVCILRISNGPVNALRFADWQALTAFYSGLPEKDVTVAVVTGLPGRHFCAGNDFTEFQDMSEEEALVGSRIVRDMAYVLRKSPIISIAAMHGAAMGAGLMSASGCDIRLGAKGGKIGLPEVKVGAFGGYRIVQEALPAAEARYLAFSGDPISNERAYELGFFQKLYDTKEVLWDSALELAITLSNRIDGPLFHQAKLCVYESSQLDFEAGFDREILTGAKVLSTHS